jgi:hypothetical protein
VTAKEKPPSDGWASESDYATGSSPLEDEFLSERQITLTVQLPPVSLPGESSEHVAERADEAAADAPVHLDAWNRDRFERKSLPPSVAMPHSASSLPPPYVPEASPDVEGDGGALALAARPSLPPPAPDLVTEMSERFALGDFSGALRASELLLGQEPEHDLALHYARESMGKLEGLYISRITAHGRTPVLLVPEGELRWYGLDSKVGALIPHIDGAREFEQVVERSGLSRLEALRCLAELVEANAVRLV